MTKRAASMIMGVLLIGGGIFITYHATFSRGSGRYEPGPVAFPMFCGLALSALGLYTVIDEYFRGERTVIKFIHKKFILGVVSVAAYTVILYYLGYIASGIMMMLALMLIMTTEPVKKVWPYMLIAAVAAPVGIYLIFAKYLLVPLP